MVIKAEILDTHLFMSGAVIYIYALREACLLLLLLTNITLKADKQYTLSNSI